MDKIRMLHFADIHIGMENYGGVDPETGLNKRALDFVDRFDELIAYGLEHEVDLVVFAGDAYKQRSPNPTYQRAFARRVKRLADAGVPVVLLVGNHDLPTMERKATTVDIFSTLEVPNVIVGRDYEVHRVETSSGPVQVATVPYPIRQRLLVDDEYRGLSIEELDEALERETGRIIREGLAQKLDPEIPSVLTAHLSVAGATYGSERGVMVGREVVIEPSVLDSPAWDYVALGHIHKYQSLNGENQPPIVYAGSLERIDFGEEGDPKGFCWVELALGETMWAFVEVNARPFVTIRADLREEDEPFAALERTIAEHHLEGAVVRLILQLRADQEPALRDYDVRALLSEAAAIGSISREVERKARVRLGDQKPEEMTDRELLRTYLEIKDTPTDRITTLMNHADAVFQWEEED
jgi:exonuclease SbcD